ncbi:MAG: hypothetical protein M1423_09575 [Acidobacteria bacterium]|nr:hypothetical protein [Acidobacteriota bacterium]
MIQTRELFPASLDHALLANRMAKVLHQIEGNEEPADRDAFDKAIKFLQFIRQGREFTQKLTLSENSYQAALAYGEAIRAIELLSLKKMPEEENIDRLLKWLVEVTENLRDNRPVEKHEIVLLDDFFKLIAEAALTSTSGPIERVEYLY